MKHNPAFLSREELVQSFVARKDDLAFVLEHLADNTGASSQHLLIVAARGMGKTSLVLRTAEAVRTEERFSKSWFPLVYAEETYEVTSAGELWLEGVRHLGEQTKDPAVLSVYRELRRERDEQRLHDRALGVLLDFADRQKKRLLLIVENLHMLLGEQISKADAWRLRKTFQTERRLLLLATATASFDAIENVDQAFFDQFRIYRLDPLDLEGARHVWEHVAGAPVPPEQMRPLQILTGGNPRLLAILASFAGGMSLRELMGDLVRLVDDHTTYFKANLDSLPAKERKVYVTLADLWQPSLAREVAEQARLSPSEASALLNRLTQRGAVTASGDERRKTYQLAERMYNIYHLLRRSGGDDTRVRAAINFMVGFYHAVSPGKAAGAIAQEGASVDDEDWCDHLTAAGRWNEARGHLVALSAPSGSAKASADPGEKTRGYWTRTFIDAAATGHAREALELLEPSPLARSLEPVVAALHAILGELYRAPHEIAEVASDVAERIRKREEALKRRSAEAASARTPRHPTRAKASARSAHGSRGKTPRRSGAVPPT